MWAYKKDLAATRARGRKSGRPSLPEYKKWGIKFLYDEQKLTGKEIDNQTGESRATIYRVVKVMKNLSYVLLFKHAHFIILIEQVG